MEEWRDIPEFLQYEVSSRGRVRNKNTGRIMAITRNQREFHIVGLMRGGIQHKRSISVLVAEAFIPKQMPTFDTPIHLDGDRYNNYAENLVWRPRWFAIRYYRQFITGVRGFKVPIEDVKTGERFMNSWDAAVKYGLIDREIMTATINRTYVWPTYQQFRVLDTH